jgi:acetylornithine aminotransferase
VQEIRHLGLLIGIELQQDCKALVSQAVQQGLLLNVTAERVIRLLPPLIIDQQQTDDLAKQLIACINEFTQAG